MIAVLTLLLIVPSEPPKPIDSATFDRLAIDSLRDVHNRGAALYNDGKDYAGCYRLYEGSIRTVQPLLAHRPAIQKIIETQLAKLDSDESVRAKAFRLHELIETVRGELRDGAAPASFKIISSPMPVPLNSVPQPSPVSSSLSGLVTVEGKPVAGAEMMFVTLEVAEPKVMSIKTDETGRYRLPTLAKGNYAVVITGTSIPERYSTTTTSGLRVTCKGDAQVANWDLNR